MFGNELVKQIIDSLCMHDELRERVEALENAGKEAAVLAKQGHETKVAALAELAERVSAAESVLRDLRGLTGEECWFCGENCEELERDEDDRLTCKDLSACAERYDADNGVGGTPKERRERRERRERERRSTVAKFAVRSSE